MSENEREGKPRVSASELRQLATEVLERVGVADVHADRVADALVRADLRGVDSHGLARLDTYVKKFEAGGFDTDPEVTVERVDQAAVLVDGDDGPGQSVGIEAIDAAMDLADETGVGVAAVTNSNHFGTSAFYTERASSQDYLAVAMTNVGPDVAPFGGFEPFLGTNPISFSSPTDRDFPFTLDMATSTVAMGKIDHAIDEDSEIPESWAFDESGEPTTEPESVEALRPVGGPKGYGLAIMVDVLCGILTGVGTSPSAGALYDDFDDPMRLGHFFAVIDPDSFRDVESFKTDVGSYVDRLKSQETRGDVDEIRLPGEIEAMTKERNEREGVPLNDDAIGGLRSLVDRYDVDAPDSLF